MEETLVTIRLDTIRKVHDFVEIVTKFDEEITIKSHRYEIDAKSIMGIFSLDLSKPIDLNIHADDNVEEIMEMLKPYLFKSVVNGKGQTTAEGKSEKLVETMDTDTAQEIKEAMKAAAQSYGMSTVGEKEYSIAAKTGTAERGDGTNNAWLVTFAPADNPQYVIVANRLKTTEIGKTLAPVVEDLYNTLFDAN
mgnify:CR=1 FL=1